MREVFAYLKELGQEHLSLGLDRLSPEECRAFLQQLRRYGPALAKQRAALSNARTFDLFSVCPVSVVPSCGMSSDALLGQQLIAEGKVGCLILAGGQGTRLGHSGPKGTLPLIENKSLFQLFAERILAVGKGAPVAIMTSPLNDLETRAFFETHALFGLHPSQLSFFSQHMLPLIDAEGNWMLKAPGRLAEGPDGNGNALSNFFEQGLGAAWIEQGVEYINVIFVDNPLADPFDAEFVGFAHRLQLDIGMKVVKRLSLDEKMGLVVRHNEKLKVVEYSEFSEEASHAFPLASPGLFCFRMEFLRDLRAELPLHLARKKAVLIPANSTTQQEQYVFKCETFQFDLLDHTDRSAALLYPRDRTYAPIKNASGDKSPDTARAAIYRNEFKSCDFGKEAAPIFVSGANDHC